MDRTEAVGKFVKGLNSEMWLDGRSVILEQGRVLARRGYGEV